MKAFHEHWLKLHMHDTTMKAVNARLHAERTRTVKQTAVCADLPRGAMVSFEDRSWLVVEDGLYAWNHDGYSDFRAFPPGPVDVPDAAIDRRRHRRRLETNGASQRGLTGCVRKASSASLP
jgi:hypothetical protein